MSASVNSSESEPPRDTHLSLAPTLQRSPRESKIALERISRITSSRQLIVTPVLGVPSDQPPAYRFSDYSRQTLEGRIEQSQTPSQREALILDWAQARGRVSSTEVADLTGLTAAFAGKLLTELTELGHLIRSRPNRMGRGFHYLPANSPTD